MNSKNVVIAVAIPLALGFLGWFVFVGTDASAPEPKIQPASPAAILEEMGPKPVTVTYTDSGFSPASVTVPAGTTVTFVNNTSHAMWVGSDEHPTHTHYDQTAKNAHCIADYAGAKPFDQCTAGTAGTSWSFTFDKAGTWAYHDHVNAGARGTVVVNIVAADDSMGI